LNTWMPSLEKAFSNSANLERIAGVSAEGALTGAIAGGIAGGILNPVEGALGAMVTAGSLSSGMALTGTIIASVPVGYVSSATATGLVSASKQVLNTGNVNLPKTLSEAHNAGVGGAIAGPIGAAAGAALKPLVGQGGGGDIVGFLPQTKFNASSLQPLGSNITSSSLGSAASTGVAIGENVVGDTATAK